MLFNWISINKLAIGTPLLTTSDKNLLKEKAIYSILDLRNESDLLDIDTNKYFKLVDEFNYLNIPLPDHKFGRFMNAAEIKKTVFELEKLIKIGPVFMHCHAAAERSPLISIAYLFKNKGLSLVQACDYVKQQNKSTNLHIKQIEFVNLALFQ